MRCVFRACVLALTALATVGLSANLPNASDQSKRVTAPVPADMQAQLEQKIVAAAEANRLGTSMACGGQTLVLGAPDENEGRGAVHVYNLGENGDWALAATLTASDASPGDHFGQAVALDGGLIIVGAPGDDVGAKADQGSAYLFVSTGGVWAEINHLFASDGAAGDGFGSSVDVDEEGGDIVVGGPKHDLPGAPDGGSAYAYVLQGDDTWAEQVLQASRTFAWYNFGAATAVRHGTLVIGAPGTDGQHDRQGAAHFFQRSDLGWQALPGNPVMQGSENAAFGGTVVIQEDGTIAVIGAQGHKPTSDCIDCGAAFLFDVSSGTPILQTTVTLTSPAPGDKFGAGVGLVPGKLALGAPGRAIPGEVDTGAVVVYGQHQGNWIPTDTIYLADNADGVAADRRFGSKTVVTADQVMVGAPDETIDGLPLKGSVSVFSTAPYVVNVNPTSGPTEGGTEVTISVLNFNAGATVYFDGIESPLVSLLDSQTLTATTPAHDAGTVSITLTNPRGPSSASYDGFTYEVPLSVEGVRPDVGPKEGHTPVTIELTGFEPDGHVYFGDAEAQILSNTGSTVVVETPPLGSDRRPNPLGVATAVDVKAVNPDSQEAILEDGFTYASVDLLVTALVAPAAIGPGATLNVTDKTKNLGPDNVPESTTRFYLSTNATLDASDLLLGQRLVPALQPRTLSVGTLPLVIAAGQPAGQDRLIAKADDPAEVAERSESNNTRSRPLRVGADLLVSGLAAPLNVTRAVPFSLVETTKNGGPGAAPATTTRLLLSADAAVGGDDQILYERAIAGLAARATSRQATPVTLGEGLAPGTYDFLAIADVLGTVPETSEANNTRAKRVVVK